MDAMTKREARRYQLQSQMHADDAVCLRDTWFTIFSDPIDLADAVASQKAAAYFSHKARVAMGIEEDRAPDDGLSEAARALRRQADNMAFVINHVTLPAQWLEKFMRELEEDRATIESVMK